MSYRITKNNRKTGEDKKKIHKIIKDGMKNNLTTTQIIKNLKKENVSYKKTDMLYDIRFKKASFNIGVKDDGTVTYSTPRNRKSRKRKQDWFMNVFEKFRIENNLNTRQARKLIKQEMVTSHKNKMEESLGAKFYDIYKSVFA